MDAVLFFGNEAAPIAAADTETKLRRVMLAPYGDWPNSRGLQKFAKPDADNIVKEFSNVVNKVLNPQSWLGLPWYEGHPDHPDFRGKPGHVRATAVGRIKSLEAGNDGLYANVRFNDDGESLIRNESYHGHSVNWFLTRDNGGNGYRPFKLKSVGFTNEPNIPVPAVTTANTKDALGHGSEKRGHTRQGDEMHEGMRVRATANYGGKIGVVKGFSSDKSFVSVKHDDGGHASYHHSDLNTHDDEDDDEMGNSTLNSRFSVMAAMRGTAANAWSEKAREAALIARKMKVGGMSDEDHALVAKAIAHRASGHKAESLKAVWNDVADAHQQSSKALKSSDVQDHYSAAVFHHRAAESMKVVGEEAKAKEHSRMAEDHNKILEKLDPEAKTKVRHPDLNERLVFGTSANSRLAVMANMRTPKQI